MTLQIRPAAILFSLKVACHIVTFSLYALLTAVVYFFAVAMFENIFGELLYFVCRAHACLSRLAREHDDGLYIPRLCRR